MTSKTLIFILHYLFTVIAIAFQINGNMDYAIYFVGWAILLRLSQTKTQN